MVVDPHRRLPKRKVLAIAPSLLLAFSTMLQAATNSPSTSERQSLVQNPSVHMQMAARIDALLDGVRS